MTPMQLGTAAELEILRDAAAVGCLLGAVYGVPAVIRRLCGKTAVWFFCDFVYSLFYGAVFFIFTLSQTDYYRFFVIAAMLFGTVLWHFSVGKLLTRPVCIFFIKFVKPLFVKINNLLRKIFLKTVNSHTNSDSPKKMLKTT